VVSNIDIEWCNDVAVGDDKKYVKKSRAGIYQSITQSAKFSKTVQKERLCIIVKKRFSNSSQTATSTKHQKLTRIF
jgi:hypothetical protein